MIYIIFIVILIILVFFYFIIQRINEMIIFQPTCVKYDELENLIINNKNNIIYESINHKNYILHGLLYNKYKIPSWDDTIILYSHGNAGWMGYLIDSPIIDLLSKYGSVFIYDYRGYGATHGRASENNAYEDIMTIWNFIINDKKIKQSNIIIYGHSLGCAISTNLISALYLQKKLLPKMIILESPFICIKKIAEKFIPHFLCNFVISNFNNNQNLTTIHNSIPIYILHSQNDEIIPYEHGKYLSDFNKCDFIEIDGTHNYPIYNNNVRDIFINTKKN
jgi:uncharacterized protein